VRGDFTKETPVVNTNAHAAPAARLAPRARAARAEGAVKVYGSGQATVRALDGLTLDLAAGHFTAIMGPSGSGKSTLLHCLAALEDLTSGRVFLGDTELGALDDKRLTLLRRQRIGVIFQSYNLLPALTATGNITLPLRIRGQEPDWDWIDRLCGITGLRGRLRHAPAELSGGEQQRVAIARALAADPQLIVGDEPTGNLDTVTAAEMFELFKQLNGEGKTVLYVTHDLELAGRAQRIVSIRDGVIVTP
jgi:putative ABC transport system ATP-binding protein